MTPSAGYLRQAAQMINTKSGEDLTMEKASDVLQRVLSAALKRPRMTEAEIQACLALRDALERELADRATPDDRALLAANRAKHGAPL
jgi:hypothetical protein